MSIRNYYETTKFSKVDLALSLTKIQFDTEKQYFNGKNGSIRPRDLAKHFSSFANASDGLVAIGIEDNGTVSSSTSE